MLGHLQKPKNILTFVGNNRLTTMQPTSSIRFSPLQGYTDAIYRQAHARFFGGVECYYSPFVRVEHGEIRRKDVRDIEPENNEGFRLVPQLIAPDLEKVLHKSLETGGAEGVSIEPGLAERLQNSLNEATSNQEMQGEPAILLTSGILRSTLSRFVKNTIPGLRVLSYQEVPDDKQIRIVTVIGNAAGHPALETIERANIGYFYDLEAFEGTAAEAAEAAIAQIAEQYAMPPGASGPDVGTGRPAWEGEISVESEGNVVDSLLCYAITRSSYTGGAHGMYSTQYHIYSLADGFELSLADLFDARQLEILDRAIREKIAETYDAVSDEDLSDRGFFPEYICPTENFRITPECIAFFYNPYEIGCYALGSVEVTFTWAELDARFAAQ